MADDLVSISMSMGFDGVINDEVIAEQNRIRSARPWILDTFPQKPGLYLWVTVFGCSCCVDRHGIVEVYDAKDTKDAFEYDTPYGRLSLVGDLPEFEDGDKQTPVVDGWLKLAMLPPPCPALPSGVVSYKKRNENHHG